MEKLLSQNEIDAIFHDAGGELPASPGPPAPQVTPWNLHQAGILSKEQLHNLSQLHEGFARNLAIALGGYLREAFEVALVSAEQLPFRDFLTRNPEPTYYSSFRLQPGDTSGVLQIDLGLAFPIVDLLLGGGGGPPQETREVTAIEEAVLEGVGQILCHELEAVWQPLGLRVEFEQRQPTRSLLRTMPAQEKTLTLTFEAAMKESRGAINIAFPAVVSSAFLRKLANELTTQRSSGPAPHREGILRRLLDSAVELELATPALPVRTAELLNMRPGTILPLLCSIEQAAQLRVKGRGCWWARPVQSATNRRAGQLLADIPQAEEEVR